VENSVAELLAGGQAERQGEQRAVSGSSIE
jgi:hypothetical protein